MVKRPIHMRLATEALNQEKLLADFQKMQITFMESILLEHHLSSEEQSQVLYSIREKLNR